MIQERDYQQKAADIGVAALKKAKGHEIIVAPTGSGKSIIIAGICHRLDAPTLVLQPNKEILEQNYKKLLQYGITDVGMYSASLRKAEVAKYTYATIGSIFRHPELFGDFRYVLVDECHVVDTKSFDRKQKGMYAQLFEALGNPSVLGLTASPYRMINRTYRDPETHQTYYTGQIQVLNRIHPFFFKKFAFNILNQTLFDKGYLAPLEYQVSQDSEFDLSRILLNAGGTDFDARSLEAYMGQSRRVAMVVNIIADNLPRIKRNLVFASSLGQATLIRDALRAMGQVAEVVSSYDTLALRNQKIQAFEQGLTTHLINVGVLTTGYDLPSLDTVTLGRPTFSLGLHYQMIGRVVRPDPQNPQKRGLVLDATQNTLRLGRIETIRIAREKGGFKNVVETEVGILSGVPLFKFLVKNERLTQAMEGTGSRHPADPLPPGNAPGGDLW
jgi:DNA repair protein RadD